MTTTSLVLVIYPLKKVTLCCCHVYMLSLVYVVLGYMLSLVYVVLGYMLSLVLPLYNVLGYILSLVYVILGYMLSSPT